MNVQRRGRVLGVVTLLIAGGLGVMSSTQTWLIAVFRDGSGMIDVPGAEALPLLAPLSLAVLALGGALAIAGLVLRYLIGVLAVAAGGLLLAMTLSLLVSPGLGAVASSVTAATGLAGESAIETLIVGIETTPWIPAAIAAWLLLILGAGFTLVTARRWRRGGSRFQTPTTSAGPGSGRVDAVDSWDDLSRGADPTR